MAVSKSKIRKIGDALRDDYPVINEENIKILEEFRTSYKGAITTTYNKIYKLSIDILPNSVTTFRIKRIESIISKLNRIPKMKLDRMGDIAGCRCILNSNKQVYKLREKIIQKFNVKSENDYIANPQPDGYRSLHMYVSCEESNKTVEIQLRSKEQHSWATLVEITDLIYGEKIKEKSGNTELKIFLKLLASKKIEEIEKYKIINIVMKYDFIENLSILFTRNYLPLRKQWANTERQGGTYFLIEASKEDIPEIKSFSTFDQAEDCYYSRFKHGDRKNRVLTHLPKPTYKKISLAYSNYILTYHDFMMSFLNMIEDVISDTLQEGKYLKNTKYFDFYLKQLSNHMINLNNEIDAVSNNNNNNNQKEWLIDIKSEMQQIEKRKTSLMRKMKYIRITNPIVVSYLKRRYMKSSRKWKLTT